MLIKRLFYTDWEKAQEDMHKANEMGFDSYMVYDPNHKGWNVTFRTLHAEGPASFHKATFKTLKAA